MNLCDLCMRSASRDQEPCMGCSLAAQAKGANIRANRSERERAKIVARLRQRANELDGRPGLSVVLDPSGALREEANAIERGEHQK